MGHRYIGAKTQIIDSVVGHISRITVKNAKIADIMCGTAAVSSALRNSGYTVLANDVMTYSYHHARVALHLNRQPAFMRLKDFVKDYLPKNSQKNILPSSGYEKVLRALNNVPSKKGYFWREFSSMGAPNNGEKARNYFTPENAAKIDAIRYWIQLFKAENLTSDLEHSLLIHDLVMAANDVANIAGTYGHFLSKTVSRATLPIALTPTQLLSSNGGKHHLVYQGYAEDIAAKISCDLCYVDPPYMKRQYAANYHVLETLARGDEPEAIGISGLRPWRDQYSNFCTKTKISDSFARMVGTMDCPQFLISYSEDGLLSINQLRNILGEFGSVSVSTLPNKRFKSNESRLSSTLTEYLVHLVKN